MRKFYLLLSLVSSSLVFPTFSWAYFDYKAFVTAGQEYNDNVNETSHPKHDFISIVSAGAQINYHTSRIEASIDYQGDLRKYDNGQRQDELLHNLEAKAAVQAIENLLVVDVSDSNHMVFNNATQGPTQAADSTANMVNQNILSAGATLTPHFADRTQTKFGYQVTTALYDSSSAVNKFTQTVFADVLHELTPKMEIGANVQAQHQDTTKQDLSRFIASVVGRYTYGESCFIFGRIGAVETVYDNGNNSLLPTWSAGITHTLGRTVLTLESQGDYVDNPSTANNSFRALYSATISYAFERAKLTGNVSYADYSGEGTAHTEDFTTTAQVEYELTQRLSALVSASRVNSASSSGDTTRLYGTAELRYQFPKDITAKLYYRHKTNDSNSLSSSSYQVNIVGLSLTKTF
jgi:hypothetical protein